jgi:hypothetical protein
MQNEQTEKKKGTTSGGENVIFRDGQRGKDGSWVD